MPIDANLAQLGNSQVSVTSQSLASCRCGRFEGARTSERIVRSAGSYLGLYQTKLGSRNYAVRGDYEQDEQIKMQATLDIPTTDFEDIARRVFSEMCVTQAPSQDDPEATETNRRIRRILAKEFITIREAALLLSCSRSHIDNLIGKAREGTTDSAIPVRDLEGLFVFNREELLAWSRKPKQNNKRKSRKGVNH